MITLYYTPGACSMASHIILRESELPFTAIPVNLATHTLEDGSDYYHISPTGQVPLLVLEDGTPLSEGVAILQYLADQVPAKALAPENGTLGRYQLQEALNFISSELHKTFSPLFRQTTHESTQVTARERLRTLFVRINQRLSAQPWFCGERFSIADAYLFTVTRWAAYANVDLSDLSALNAYMTRVAERPAVKATLLAENRH
ncbi:glutathione transferase GstA [Dickeya lacustris]|uniref:glutathione transferase GstA n=1 Tax=Dickeya lacustris TaxID=2259638 RepID=UPI003A4C5627